MTQMGYFADADLDAVLHARKEPADKDLRWHAQST